MQGTEFLQLYFETAFKQPEQVGREALSPLCRLFRRMGEQNKIAAEPRLVGNPHMIGLK